MSRHLQHQIASRPAHPIKHHEVTAGLHATECLGPALIDADGADGVGFAGILRAVLAPRPRCADAADEIERGIEALWQFDRDLAVADSEGVLGHESSPPAKRVGPAAPVPGSRIGVGSRRRRCQARSNKPHSRGLDWALPGPFKPIKISLYA